LSFKQTSDLEHFNLGVEEETEPEVPELPETKKVTSCPVLPDGPPDDGICGVCGDALEKFFDSEEEEWKYKDAIRINGKVLIF